MRCESLIEICCQLAIPVELGRLSILRVHFRRLGLHDIDAEYLVHVSGLPDIKLVNAAWKALFRIYLEMVIEVIVIRCHFLVGFLFSVIFVGIEFTDHVKQVGALRCLGSIL